MIKLWCIDKKAFERKIVLRQNQDCQKRSGGRRQWEKESERNYMFQETNDMYFRMLSPLVWWNWNWWRRKDFFSLRKSTSLCWVIDLCATVLLQIKINHRTVIQTLRPWHSTPTSGRFLDQNSSLDGAIFAQTQHFRKERDEWPEASVYVRKWEQNKKFVS